VGGCACGVFRKAGVFPKTPPGPKSTDKELKCFLYWLQERPAEKVLLTPEALQSAIAAVRDATDAAFPGGLPERDPFEEELRGTRQLPTEVRGFKAPTLASGRCLFYAFFALRPSSCAAPGSCPQVNSDEVTFPSCNRRLVDFAVPSVCGTLT